MHPTEICGAPHRKKQRQPLQRPIRQLALAAVTVDQRVAGSGIDAVARDEVQGGGKLKQMPAEARVIEVYHLDSRAIDEQILRDEVGMNEPIAIGLRAKGGKVARNLRACAQQQALLSRRQCGEFLHPQAVYNRPRDRPFSSSQKLHRRRRL